MKRKELIESCENDQEIMLMTLAALNGRGKDELWELATKTYLQSKIAKERNLAISIVPWFGTEIVIKLLDDLKLNDPSLWVREHASWAMEVARQEYYCKELYRWALLSGNITYLSASLQRIKPALFPSVRLWRYNIEKEVGWNFEERDPRLAALVERFWNNWELPQSQEDKNEIVGRKLDEYCRGEKLENRHINLTKQISTEWS